MWIVLRFELDGLCGEVESEAQRLLDLLVLPPRDAVGRELQGYDHRRERQHVQFFLRRVQDGQGRLQHAWSMERLRLRRIIEISTFKGFGVARRLVQRHEDLEGSSGMQPNRSPSAQTATVFVRL